MQLQTQFEVSTTSEVDGTIVASSEISIENRTIRKLQIRLLPFLFILYVVAFVDRINIGFAALTMNKELAITSQQFGFAAGVFFFGYSLFEVPSNLLLHKIGARIWIARILITWGILAALTGFVHSVHRLYVLRFLLGLAEAGYFPGIVLYLSYWFRQREQARALALFMTALPVTSVLGAPMSGFILDHVHWLSLSSWRWLLILEGLPAVVFGILTYFVLPNRPAEAKFLTAEEKEWLHADLLREERKKLEQRHYSVLQTLLNRRVLCLGVIEFGILIGSYTFSFWGPQLIKSLSGQYSNTTVGLLVMIPYAVGTVVMIVVSRSSDRHLERQYHAGFPVLLGGIALLLIGRFHSPFVLIVLLSLVAIGAYGWCAPFFTLPCEFLTGPAAAAGVALINSIGNLGGFVGPYAVGVMSGWAGGIHRGIALVGIPLLFSGISLLLLPKNASANSSMRKNPSARNGGAV
ncbi:MAG TPA: MFS transporter [Terriglobales bacterium]|nr:MFS transporter [Terriglobales bacterium]